MTKTVRVLLALGLGSASIAAIPAAVISENVPLAVRPTASTHALADLSAVPRLEAARVDFAAVSLEDVTRELDGLPPRFAIPNAVRVTPGTAGAWETIEDGASSVWRLVVTSPGAVSLNLGFTRYEMPQGGRLFVYAADFREVIRPFTARDNADHGELWTPPVGSDTVVVELTVPTAAKERVVLELTSVNVGYRGFGDPVSPLSGSCNIDVVCPQGDPWRSEIPSVAVISTGGSTFCTGFMVNNTAQDQKPFFMTANHCGITAGNAGSLVAFWNYETSTCGGTPNGVKNKFNTGAFWRASSSASDFTLVELDSPPNPDWGVTFAGWDKTGADATSAVAIHHPDTDEKRISFENDPTTTTSYLQNAVPGDGTHVRVIDWDAGTTEPGSSGSPLFNQNHHVIGQLHGGFASCTSQTSDWYGKFSRSWTGGGTNTTRLSNWLDASGTGASTLDTLVPNAPDCNDNGVPDNQDISSGFSEDCNENGVPDECDIASGSSADANGNGIPDECEGSSIPCSDIVTLQATCKQGTLTARVTLTNPSHNGESVTISIDGVSHTLTIVKKKAIYTQGGQGGSGQRTVTLTDPAGCKSPVVTTCN
jgi:hypothetical protein